MQKIKVDTIIQAPVQKVWEHWNAPESIKGWAFASDTWGCPHAENDLRVDGRFLTRMSAKDGTAAFDFTGTYTEVVDFKKIKYRMDKLNGEEQNRECEVAFTDLGDGTTKVEEEFDPENLNSLEVQKGGWQAIINNFKHYVETHK